MASKLAEMNPITTNLHIQLQIGCFITSFISGLSAQKFAE
jgi:molybdopterin-binding protein